MIMTDHIKKLLTSLDNGTVKNPLKTVSIEKSLDLFAGAFDATIFEEFIRRIPSYLFPVHPKSRRHDFRNVDLAHLFLLNHSIRAVDKSMFLQLFFLIVVEKGLKLFRA